MSRKTAVAAPAQPPFDDLLASIDAMDGPTLRAFIAALRARYTLAELTHVAISVNAHGVVGDNGTTWIESFDRTAWQWPGGRFVP